MGQANYDSISEFIDFLHDRGIPPADSRDIIANDQIRRYTVDGDRRHSKNGVYRLGIVDGMLIGWARSHKQGTTHNFYSAGYKKLTADERKALDKKIEQKREESKKRQQEDHAEGRRKADALLQTARPADGNHPYLRRKEIPAGTLKQSGDHLLIPVYDAYDKLWNVQQIGANGFKLFIEGARIKGCMHRIGTHRPMIDDPFVICEGYATGATIHMATGWPVYVAFNANNLVPVGCALRYRHNYARFVYAADNDRWTTKPDGTPWNPGLDYAKQAAGLTGGRVVTIPTWVAGHNKPGLPERPTDFNDMAAIAGIEQVAATLKKGAGE